MFFGPKIRAKSKLASVRLFSVLRLTYRILTYLQELAN